MEGRAVVRVRERNNCAREALRIPSRAVRSEALHDAETRALRDDHVRAPPPPSERLHCPPSAGGPRPFDRGSGSRGIQGPRGDRQLLEEGRRSANSGRPHSRATVPPRGELRKLWKAVRSLERGGDRGGPHHPRPPGRSRGRAREVRVGDSVPCSEPRAARGVCDGDVAGGPPRGSGRVYLKSGGKRFGMPSLISYVWLHDLQYSVPSRISSFSRVTFSSRSPLHTGQHRISMRSRFIAVAASRGFQIKVRGSTKGLNHGSKASP